MLLYHDKIGGDLMNPNIDYEDEEEFAIFTIILELDYRAKSGYT